MTDNGHSEKTGFHSTETDSTESRFYPIWIHSPAGKTKTVEIQATSIEDARSKAILHYKTANRILVVVP